MAVRSCAEISERAFPALGEISTRWENESTAVLLKHRPHGVLVRHKKPSLPHEPFKALFGGFCTDLASLTDHHVVTNDYLHQGPIKNQTTR